MRKLLWLAVSGLMALSLVLAACGTASTSTTQTTSTAATTTTTATMPTTTATTPTTTTTSAASAAGGDTEKPKYGGTYTETVTTQPQGFDPLVVPLNSDPTLQFTHDTLLGGDWTKGPAGTGETDWLYGILGRTDLFSGQLATSWEIPDNQTIIYHIRPGVHWQNKAPVNGRELVAADVAWCLNMEWNTKGTNWDIFYAKPDHEVSANATDKYTVVCTVPAHALGTIFLEDSERCYIRAPEVTQQFGNQNDWHNQNTTGPFYVSDYVPGSIIDYKKNPGYWETNPVGPGKGDQLPYIDGVVQLIVPDTSTRIAAFRVGKVDLYKSLAWEDAADLMKKNTSLKSVVAYTSSLFLAGRVDKQNLPFKDVRVRQALNMAVDKQSIVDNYYGGHAVVYSYPFPPAAAYADFYTPFDQLSPTAQSVFKYDPDKAKQLLAEAGYPNGFKTSIVVQSLGTNVDYVAIVKDYLAKIGVDMTIMPLDPTVYANVSNARSNDEMIARVSTMASLPYMLHEGRADSSGDFSYWQDDKTLAAYQLIQNNLGKNDAVWVKGLKDVTNDMLENAWGIFMPQPQVYHVWWPWVKNFHGEVSTGYFRNNRNTRYLWIDQDLKKSMGY